MSLHVMIAEEKLKVLEGQKKPKEWKKCLSVTLYPNRKVIVFDGKEKHEYEVYEVRLWNSYRWYYVILFRYGDIILTNEVGHPSMEYYYDENSKILYLRLGSAEFCPFK